MNFRHSTTFGKGKKNTLWFDVSKINVTKHKQWVIKEERKLNNNKKETTFIQETTLCVFIVEYLVYN